VYIVNIHKLVNIHGAHSYWKQGALGAAGVRDGLQLSRSFRAAASSAGWRILADRARLGQPGLSLPL